MKRFINLLKADIAVEGSNERKSQNEVYSKFIKHAREAADKSFLEYFWNIGKRKYERPKYDNSTFHIVSLQ